MAARSAPGSPSAAGPTWYRCAVLWSPTPPTRSPSGRPTPGAVGRRGPLPHRPGRSARARTGRRPGVRGAHHLAAGLPWPAELALRGPAGASGRAGPGLAEGRRRLAARGVAAGRMATGGRRAHRLLAVQPARRHPAGRAGAAGQDPLADRTRLPRGKDRPRAGPLRGPHLHRLAPPRHPGHRRLAVSHHSASRPKSRYAGLSLYAVLRELQAVLATWTGVCITCGQPAPRPSTAQT